MLVKPYAIAFFGDGQEPFPTVEIVWTQSHAKVLRGMHFQREPYASTKFMWCTAGALLEVVLDLRPTSPAYRSAHSVELTPTGTNGILIPAGCAHGFLALSDDTTVCYLLDKPFDSASDSGVRWDSFGFDWGTNNPLLSERDLNLRTLDELFPTEH